MKRLLLCLILLMLALPAHAETYTGRVREDMSHLAVAVTQEGEFDHNARHPYTLAAHITSADGSLAQETSGSPTKHPTGSVRRRWCASSTTISTDTPICSC